MLSKRDGLLCTGHWALALGQERHVKVCAHWLAAKHLQWAINVKALQNRKQTMSFQSACPNISGKCSALPIYSFNSYSASPQSQETIRNPQSAAALCFRVCLEAKKPTHSLGLVHEHCNVFEQMHAVVSSAKSGDHFKSLLSSYTSPPYALRYTACALEGLTQTHLST